MSSFNLSTIGRAAKAATIGAIKGVGETTVAVVETTRDVLLTAVKGATDVTTATTEGAAKPADKMTGQELLRAVRNSFHPSMAANQ